MIRNKILKEIKSYKNKKKFDIFIIGGGVNGAITAASLSIAGYKVGLAEKNDFSSCTSQASSNLIWGGIKYLENLEFNLIWNLCKSRNRLLSAFPDLVKEIRFYHPHSPGAKFPLFFLKIGVWLYWFLGRMKLQKPRFLSKKNIQNNAYSVSYEQVSGGVEYSDAYLTENDTRLVLTFIKIAIKNGAKVCNYLNVNSLKKKGNSWLLTLNNTAKTSGEGKTVSQKNAKKSTLQNTFNVESRIIVNAAGPYIDSVNRKNNISSKHEHLFSKGIHIIVNRVFSAKKILTFFSKDGRPFFVIPMGPCSCIGTTDTFQSKEKGKINPADISFVLDNINSMLSLTKPLNKKNIISTRCGVRPLATPIQKNKNISNNNANWLNFSRKHILDSSTPQILMIYGGKLTDCLNLGKEVVEVCNQWFKNNCPVSNTLSSREVLGKNGKFFKSLPTQKEKKLFFKQCEKTINKNSEYPPSLFSGIWRRHGEDANEILQLMLANKKNTEIVLPTCKITLAEIVYFIKKEMVVTAEDLLRRRSMEQLVCNSKSVLKKNSLRISKLLNKNLVNLHRS